MIAREHPQSSSEGRIMRCLYVGREYLIPEVWVMGYTTANRCPVVDAVAWWAYQTQLAEGEVS